MKATRSSSSWGWWVVILVGGLPGWDQGLACSSIWTIGCLPPATISSLCVSSVPYGASFWGSSVKVLYSSLVLTRSRFLVLVVTVLDIVVV